jgi:hypothetical protein
MRKKVFVLFCLLAVLICACSPVKTGEIETGTAENISSVIPQANETPAEGHEASETPITSDFYVNTGKASFNSCQKLNSANKVYLLSKNIQDSATCLSIEANNVTLDCQGFRISYAATKPGYGIQVLGVNGTIVKNCTIIKQSKVQNSGAIYAVNANSSIFANNLLNSSGNYSSGIILVNSNFTNISRNMISLSGKGSFAFTLLRSGFNNITINKVGVPIGAEISGVSITDSGHNNFVKNTITVYGRYSSYEVDLLPLVGNKTSGGGGGNSGGSTEPGNNTVVVNNTIPNNNTLPINNTIPGNNSTVNNTVPPNNSSQPPGNISSSGIFSLNTMTTNIWMDNLASQLAYWRQHKVKYLIVDVGDTGSNGIITTPDSDIHSFISAVQAYEISSGYNFITLPYSEVNTDNYNFNEAFTGNMTKDYQRFIAMGFEGAYVDVEPVKLSQRTLYINFLKKLKQTLPVGSVVAVYSANLDEASDDWAWPYAFFKQVSNYTDVIELQGYDEGFSTTANYKNYITAQVSSVASKSWTSTFWLGVPTHNPAPETLANALDAYKTGLASKAGPFIGVSIFAEWTITSADWTTFESITGVK